MVNDPVRILIVHDEDTGLSRTYTPPIGVFTLSEVGEILRVTVGEQFGEVGASVLPGFWFMSFVAPPGERLSPGIYRNAGCLSPYGTGRAPSMEIADNPVCLDGDTVWGVDIGQSCADASGLLKVRAIETATSGEVTGLHAEFHYKCTLTGPPLRGTIRYHL